MRMFNRHAPGILALCVGLVVALGAETALADAVTTPETEAWYEIIDPDLDDYSANEYSTSFSSWSYVQYHTGGTGGEGDWIGASVVDDGPSNGISGDYGYGSASAYANQYGVLFGRSDYYSMAGEESLEFEGIAKTTTTFTNNTGAAQYFAMDFVVDPGHLELLGNFTEGVPTNPNYFAEIQLEIWLNGASSWWSYNRLEADLDNNLYAFNSTGQSLGFADTSSGNAVRYGSTQYNGNLSLGLIGDGDEIEIVYQLTTRVLGSGGSDGNPYGATARIGDPFNFSGTPPGIEEGLDDAILGFGNQQDPLGGPTNFSIIPEPATMSLLGLGLAGLAIKRFRRKRS